MLADQPDLFAGKMLLPKVTNALRRAVSHPHAHGSKARCALDLGAAAPAYGLPLGALEYRMGRTRSDVRHMVLARSSATRDREHHGNTSRIDLLLLRDAHRPDQIALSECLPKRTRQSTAIVGQYAA
jgi:hypothetical protein